MDFKALLSVVKTVGAAFVPGLPGMLEAGEAVIDLVKSVRPTLDNNKQAELDAALPALLTKMNLNVNKAIADLRGEG